jgi:hypothetical protein
MVYEQQYNALWGQFVDLETGKFTKNPTLYSRSITPNHINYSNKNKNKMLSSISEETNDDINNDNISLFLSRACIYTVVINVSVISLMSYILLVVI